MFEKKNGRKVTQKVNEIKRETISIRIVTVIFTIAFTRREKKKKNKIKRKIHWRENCIILTLMFCWLRWRHVASGRATIFNILFLLSSLSSPSSLRRQFVILKSFLFFSVTLHRSIRSPFIFIHFHDTRASIDCWLISTLPKCKNEAEKRDRREKKKQKNNRKKNVEMKKK